MKLLYDVLFGSQEDKISDKDMNKKVAGMCVVILLCLICMAFSAFGYFSSSVYSSNNILKSAHYDLDISTNNGTIENNKIELSSNVDYEITLKYSYDSTATTGFCMIYTENSDDVYHTQQIEKGKSITIKIKSQTEVTIILKPHWGTSSMYSNNMAPSYYITQTEEAFELTFTPTNSINR